MSVGVVTPRMICAGGEILVGECWSIDTINGGTCECWSSDTINGGTGKCWSSDTIDCGDR